MGYENQVMTPLAELRRRPETLRTGTPRQLVEVARNKASAQWNPNP